MLKHYPNMSPPEFLKMVRELAGTERERSMKSTTVVARAVLAELVEQLEDTSQELALCKEALAAARARPGGHL